MRRIASLLGAALTVACGGGAGEEPGPARPSVESLAAVPADVPGSTLAAFWTRGPIMQIFVRAYQDSDGDGVGDLQGLIRRLGYLHDLGVTGLWLMPVSHSQDHDHGYAVVDYRGIEPDYGSLADFNRLVVEAHARGIGVILDYVMNHSAAQHPLFENSRHRATNPWREWYVWKDATPSAWTVYGQNPWRQDRTGVYYAPFWDQMPDFNLRNEAVVQWHLDNLRFWLNRGVDGFRFDAVGNLFENGPGGWESQPESHPLMNRVAALVHAYPGRTLVCEAPGTWRAFADPTSCGSAFAFGHQYDLIQSAKGDAGAIARVADHLSSSGPGFVSFLSNHDAFAGQRVFDQLNGDEGAYKLAAALLLLTSTTPYLYYGEEIGMAGGAGLSGDAKLRTPMSWESSTSAFSSARPFRAPAANVATHNVQSQAADANSLLSAYRRLIALRRSQPALRDGTTTVARAHASSPNVLEVRRQAIGQQAMLIFNLGPQAQTVQLSGLSPGRGWRRAWPAGEGTLWTADPGGSMAVAVSPRSVVVLLQ